VGSKPGQAASLVGPLDHYGELLAHASTWCLLEPSRVVFRSFCGLNHLLPVCLFGVYDNGLRAIFWINPPTYKYSLKLMEVINLNPYTYVW
jgi:hypothetical protein